MDQKELVALNTCRYAEGFSPVPKIWNTTCTLVLKEGRWQVIPQGIVRLSDFDNGQLWIESPTGPIYKMYMGEPGQKRRVVLVAYTLMGSISIAQELE